MREGGNTPPYRLAGRLSELETLRCHNVISVQVENDGNNRRKQ